MDIKTKGGEISKSNKPARKFAKGPEKKTKVNKRGPKKQIATKQPSKNFDDTHVKTALFANIRDNLIEERLKHNIENIKIQSKLRTTAASRPTQCRNYITQLKHEIRSHRIKSRPCSDLRSLEDIKSEIDDYRKNLVGNVNYLRYKIKEDEQETVLVPITPDTGCASCPEEVTQHLGKIRNLNHLVQEAEKTIMTMKFSLEKYCNAQISFAKYTSTEPTTESGKQDKSLLFDKTFSIENNFEDKLRDEVEAVNSLNQSLLPLQADKSSNQNLIDFSSDSHFEIIADKPKHVDISNYRKENRNTTNQSFRNEVQAAEVNNAENKSARNILNDPIKEELKQIPVLSPDNKNSNQQPANLKNHISTFEAKSLTKEKNRLTIENLPVVKIKKVLVSEKVMEMELKSKRKGKKPPNETQTGQTTQSMDKNNVTLNKDTNKDETTNLNVSNSSDLCQKNNISVLATKSSAAEKNKLTIHHMPVIDIQRELVTQKVLQIDIQSSKTTPKNNVHQEDILYSKDKEPLSKSCSKCLRLRNCKTYICPVISIPTTIHEEIDKKCSLSENSIHSPLDVGSDPKNAPSPTVSINTTTSQTTSTADELEVNETITECDLLDNKCSHQETLKKSEAQLNKSTSVLEDIDNNEDQLNKSTSVLKDSINSIQRLENEVEFLYKHVDFKTTSNSNSTESIRSQLGLSKEATTDCSTNEICKLKLCKIEENNSSEYHDMYCICNRSYDFKKISSDDGKIKGTLKANSVKSRPKASSENSYSELGADQSDKTSTKPDPSNKFQECLKKFCSRKRCNNSNCNAKQIKTSNNNREQPNKDQDPKRNEASYNSESGKTEYILVNDKSMQVYSDNISDEHICNIVHPNLSKHTKQYTSSNIETILEHSKMIDRIKQKSNQFFSVLANQSQNEIIKREEECYAPDDLNQFLQSPPQVPFKTTISQDINHRYHEPPEIYKDSAKSQQSQTQEKNKFRSGETENSVIYNDNEVSQDSNHPQHREMCDNCEKYISFYSSECLFFKNNKIQNKVNQTINDIRRRDPYKKIVDISEGEISCQCSISDGELHHCKKPPSTESEYSGEIPQREETFSITREHYHNRNFVSYYISKSPRSKSDS